MKKNARGAAFGGSGEFSYGISRADDIVYLMNADQRCFARDQIQKFFRDYFAIFGYRQRSSIDSERRESGRALFDRRMLKAGDENSLGLSTERAKCDP